MTILILLLMARRCPRPAADLAHLPRRRGCFAMILLVALPTAAQNVGSTRGLLMPPLLDITSIVLLPCRLKWRWVKRKFGIVIAVKHREALRAALMSRAQLPPLGSRPGRRPRR